MNPSQPGCDAERHEDPPVYKAWNAMPFVGHFVVSVKPNISLFTGGFQDEIDAVIPASPEDLAPDVLIEMLSSWMHDHKARTVAARYGAAKDGVRRLLMTNAPDEEPRRVEHGIEGFLCHESILSIEALFRPIDVPVEFDAIYVARVDPNKRHELARRVERLRLLTRGVGTVRPGGIVGSITPADVEALGLHPTVSTCCQDLTLCEVNFEINRSVCGLALSPREGAMRASTQYLLCGRPVVSTRSWGGRDVLYDDYTAIVVDDDEAAVRDAVRRLVAERRDPVEVRRRTLCRIRHFRYEFCRRLSRLRVEHGGEWLAPERIYRDLFNDFARLRERYVLAGEPADTGDGLARFEYPEQHARLVVDNGGIRSDESGARRSRSARRILECLRQGATVEAIIGELCAQGASAADADREVRDAISRFILEGVVDLDPTIE